MGASPEEIESKRFARALRGYARSEVEAFLRDVAAEVQDLRRELQAAREKTLEEMASHQLDAVAEGAARVSRTVADALRQLRQDAERDAQGIVARAHDEVEASRLAAARAVDRASAELEDARQIRASAEASALALKQAVERELAELCARSADTLGHAQRQAAQALGRATEALRAGREAPAIPFSRELIAAEAGSGGSAEASERDTGVGPIEQLEQVEHVGDGPGDSVPSPLSGSTAGEDEEMEPVGRIAALGGEASAATTAVEEADAADDDADTDARTAEAAEAADGDTSAAELRPDAPPPAPPEPGSVSSSEVQDLYAAAESHIAEMRSLAEQDLADAREHWRAAADQRRAVEDELTELRATVSRELAEYTDAAQKRVIEMQAAAQREAADLRAAAERELAQAREAARAEQEEADRE